jgi:hypothetical protein
LSFPFCIGYGDRRCQGQSGPRILAATAMARARDFLAPPLRGRVHLGLIAIQKSTQGRDESTCALCFVAFHCYAPDVSKFEL